MKKKKRSPKLSGVMRAKCASCPFRKEGYTEVAELLVSRALSEATPICHSTGDSTVVPVSKKVTRKNLACRGARDVQLRYFASLGFIAEATDEAWNQRCKQFGLPCLPTVTKELLLDWEDTQKQYSP